MANTDVPKRVHPLIKVLVLTHMAVIFSWSLPSPAPAIENGTVKPTMENVMRNPGDFFLLGNKIVKFASPTKHYMLWSGTWQSWDMFAPNPAKTDLWYDAIVTYKSGKTAIVPYPRMKSLDTVTKYFKERYRKFTERVNDDRSDAWKRPALAQRMALLAHKDPADPPVEVKLRRHWREIPAMGKEVPKGYREFVFFTYVVDQSKLRRDAGK